MKHGLFISFFYSQSSCNFVRIYVLPAWGGYVSRENISCIDKILHKARRYGFTSTLHCFEKLLKQADDKLLSGTVCSNHCLHHLLQPDRSMYPNTMSLRPRGHSFDLTKNRSFLSRQHTDARYWYSKSVCPSVCQSVRNVPVSDENGLTCRHRFFFTTR